jgi:hypothetical protein
MKYKIADLFVIPHYNGHDQPGTFVITECCGVEEASQLAYYKVLYAGDTMTYKMYEVDIEYHMEDGLFIYYPSK